MIKLQNISVIHNKNTAFEKIVLNHVNLKISRGSVIAIIGDNGAGKSTLTKVLAGEIPPSHGKVIINNEDYTNIPVAERSHIISRVFQDHMLGAALDMTVLENMLFASKRGQKRRLTIANAKDKKEIFVERLAELNMGLEDKLNYQVKHLSGGQRQALSLVMATLQPCKLLILDEHTSALDINAAATVIRLTMEIVRKHHVTTLMVTHDMKEAEHCDKILRIENGHITKISSDK